MVFEFVVSLLAAARVFVSTRQDTALEVLALRQQVAVLKRKRPRPLLPWSVVLDNVAPSLATVDRCPRTDAVSVSIGVGARDRPAGGLKSPRKSGV